MLKWGLLKQVSAVIGVELQADGMAVVAMRSHDGARKFSQMSFLPYAEQTSAGQQLKHWVSACQLEGATCHIVLGAEQYQILLVEPPEVPKEELRSAIRWRLKDLISIPLEQAVVDVFDLPEDGTRAKKKMVYVVVAQEQKVKHAIALAQEAGLRLQSIDIGELALRNLADALVSEEASKRGIAVARIRSGAGSFYIYRQGDMYLSRSFTLDYPGGLLDDLPEENLALELQRSVDYYERQMGQAPPSTIYVCGENISADKLGAVLKASLAVQIQILEPAAVLEIDGTLDSALAQKCLAAMGAAMRQQVS